MKLFVDDLRECPDGWVVARTVSDAIRMLATGGVEEVSLDHDIASYRYRNKFDVETFEGVAYYVALMNPRPVVRIHTANIAAGLRLSRILNVDYDYRIFHPRDYHVDGDKVEDGSS